MSLITYGPGGFDPQKPGNNVLTTAQVEIDPATVNLDALTAQAVTALAQNRAAIAANPATVTPLQVAQQVQRLSAQNIALIRLVLGLLDGTN